MQTQTNRQFRLRSRPIGKVKPLDLELVEVPISDLRSGEVLVRTLYLSLDPTNRIWMSDMDSYMPPVGLGEVMRGIGIGRVVASKSAQFKEGDLVSGLVGWQDYFLTSEQDPLLQVVPGNVPLPIPALLGVCGLTGLTAYFGLLEVGQAKPGETVVISAASGAVGSIAGQIAKITGCRVIGITSGPDKCRWLTDELAFDAAVDRTRPEWRDHLAQASPSAGIDLDFENVGGDIMDAVMARMKLAGRITLCGMISDYNDRDRFLGDFGKVLVRRLQVRGFIVTDFLPRWPEATEQLVSWVMEENSNIAKQSLMDWNRPRSLSTGSSPGIRWAN